MSLSTKCLMNLKAEEGCHLGCTVEFVEDCAAHFPAKIEYARNYAREHYVVRIPDKCQNAYPFFDILLQAICPSREQPGGKIGIGQHTLGFVSMSTLRRRKGFMMQKHVIGFR